MENESYQKLLQECRARKNDETGTKFRKMLEQFLKEQTEALINAAPHELEARQGGVQAIKQIYEGLTNESKQRK